MDWIDKLGIWIGNLCLFTTAVGIVLGIVLVIQILRGKIEPPITKNDGWYWYWW